MHEYIAIYEYIIYEKYNCYSVLIALVVEIS